MAVAQRVSVDEALKRVVSHADVVGAGIMTSRGALVERRGAFSDADEGAGNTQHDAADRRASATRSGRRAESPSPLTTSGTSTSAWSSRR